MPRLLYDIVFIGSGISCSLTLCHLAESLLETGTDTKLQILIIEKEGEFWNGVPYGRRSIIGALAFQNLQDFIEEPERTLFINWLVTNKQSWLKDFRNTGGLGARQWICDNQLAMEQGKWEELYLPRFLFGTYVSDRATRAADQLSRHGLAEITFLHAEATEVDHNPDSSFTIRVEDPDGIELFVDCQRVVLAIGSPPQQSIRGDDVLKQHSHAYINDIYSPSEEVNVGRIFETLAALPEREMANILIIGSNASSLEVLYLINYRPEIKTLINSVVVISRSGLLPYKICEKTVDFDFTELESLHQRTALKAGELIAAITSDLRRAESCNLNIADLRNPIGLLVSRLLGTMNMAEQETFTCQHGATFSKMMRRAGPDTRNAADELVSTGVLRMIRGDFHYLEPSSSGNGFVAARYRTPECQEDRRHPLPFALVINCGGFEELDFCSSKLMNSLIDKKICKVNSTKRGFLVNECLEASDNFYVIGPLVGGNFNRKVRFWHVESAARILGLSKLLADSLCNSLFSPDRYSPSANQTGGMFTLGTNPLLL